MTAQIEGSLGTPWVFQSAPVSPRQSQSPGPTQHSEHRVVSSSSQIRESHGRLGVLTEDRYPRRQFHPDASLVLVGIRGSGKRSLGLIAATALGRRFVTEDHFFQTATGLSRQDFLKIHGSEEFHKQDVEVSKRMLDENKTKCVIDCGLGSLTSHLQVHLKQYARTNPVIYVMRDMRQIKSFLNLEDRSARLLEAGDPSHRKCSNFEFFNLEESKSNAALDQDTFDRTSPTYSFKLREAQADFSQFVRFVAGSHLAPSTAASPFCLDVAVETRAYTHALQIKLSAFEEDDQFQFSSLESGGDVIEICVDRWDQTAVKSLSRMVASARRALKIPAVVTIQMKTTLEMYMNILQQAIRLGVDFISVDLNLPRALFEEVLASRGFTRIIVTYSESRKDAPGWQDPCWCERYRRAIALGAHIIRFSKVEASHDDNETLEWFLQEIRAKNGRQVPIIAYNHGRLGRTSQVFNPVLTPVTHSAVSAKGVEKDDQFEPQLTSSQAVAALFHSYVLDSLHFYIVGGNVSASLSPSMHNSAYELLGLQHTYKTRNISSWEDIESLAKRDDFGGASIVQPWKVKVVQKLASRSHDAEVIGAVNTLIPLRKAAAGALSLQEQARNRNRAGQVVAWHGENSDWIGIMVCLERSLSPRNVIQPKTTGLVIGAGGMARAAVYALYRMGCRNIFVYNRTVANTTALAQHFNTWSKSRNGAHPNSTTDPIRVLDSLQKPWPVGYALPTMVVSCVTHEVLDGNPGADFEMPEPWLQSASGGAVVEMAYMTSDTPLVKQIKRFRQTTGRSWVIVDGIETLIEQAVAQFEIMTGRKAPKRCMRAAVERTLQANRAYVADGEEYGT